jgi:hypothetical protein
MIEKYVSDLAAHMEVPLTEVSIEDVSPIEINPSVHLLKLWYKGHISTTLLWQMDLDRLQSGVDCDLVETKVKMALKKLQYILMGYRNTHPHYQGQFLKNL